MSNNDTRISTINIKVQLDEQNIPEEITWEASDAPFDGAKPTKSIMVGFWDAEDSNALRIDLWTKEMRVDEMDRFYYQTFLTMADSYLRATGNKKGADDMKQLAYAFGKNSGVIKDE